MKITPGGLAVLDDNLDSLLSRWVERDESLTAYDPRIETLFAALLKPGDTVIDGGANIGDHTVAYAKAVGPAGRVYAFEPYGPAYECLVYNTHAHENTVCLPLVLSDRLGRVALSANAQNAGATHIDVNRDDAEERKIGIASVPLDFFQFSQLRLIKLDTEGAEMRALYGARETLAKHRPIVIVETGEQLTRYGCTHERMLQMMAAFGYCAGELPRERPHDHSVYDVIFRPQPPKKSHHKQFVTGPAP